MVEQLVGASALALSGGQRRDEQPGRLRLVVQGNRWLDDTAAPQVQVDGRTVPARYGDNLLQVPTGRLDVQVLRRGRSARIAVDVPPGETVDLWYAGTLGHEPQQRTGVLPVLGLVLLVLNLAFVLGHFLLR